MQIDSTPDPLSCLAPVYRNRLIQTYARRLYSKLWRAPKAAQQQIEQQWQDTANAICAHYPTFDLEKPEVQQTLERRAHSWWAIKGVKGKGVDW